MENTNYKIGDVVKTSKNFKGEIIEPRNGRMIVISVTKNRPTCVYHDKIGSPYEIEFENNELDIIIPYSKES